MAGKACEGEATIPRGDMEECAECGSAVRNDLTDSRTFGFAAFCPRKASDMDSNDPGRRAAALAECAGVARHPDDACTDILCERAGCLPATTATAAPADGWRPASEPPDSDRDVLTVSRRGIMRGGFYAHIGVGAWAGISALEDPPTHWRELPPATDTPDPQAQRIADLEAALRRADLAVMGAGKECADLTRQLDAVRADWAAERARCMDLEAGRDLAALAVGALESHIAAIRAECERLSGLRTMEAQGHAVIRSILAIVGDK